MLPVNCLVYGVQTSNASAGSLMEKNLVQDLTNTADGTANTPRLRVIYIQGNWSIENNVILLSNASNTTKQIIITGLYVSLLQER